MLDLTKPVQTKDGRPVRLLCADAKKTQPIVGLVQNKDGTETLRCWSADGSWLLDDKATPKDLINSHEKRMAWVNVYPEPDCDQLHYTKKSAERGRAGRCIATVEVQYEVPAT